jgi:5-methyltetrahydropteroyltriglutamate--homocysteine methyltransferase
VTEQRFLTHEIGSLAKPSWFVKARAHRPLEGSDVAEAERWGAKLGVDGYEQLVELLRRGEFGQWELEELGAWASRYALALLEQAGLDVVFDGEQQRTEMYAWAIEHANGFEQRGTVRSFDNK